MVTKHVPCGGMMHIFLLKEMSYVSKQYSTNSLGQPPNYLYFGLARVGRMYVFKKHSGSRLIVSWQWQRQPNAFGAASCFKALTAWYYMLSETCSQQSMGTILITMIN